MNDKLGACQIVDLPPERHTAPKILDLSHPKHPIFGMLEVDVTVARQFIAAQRVRTGQVLSFTGFLAFCLARAVDENKAVQAYMKGSRKLLVLDDVNVGLMVEHRTGDKRVLMGHVILGANHKTYPEIHREIRAVQSQPVPPNGGMPSWLRFVLLLPWPFPWLFNALLGIAMGLNPTILPSMMGTVGITAVGMFGKGLSGWGIVPTLHSLDLVVGSISLKPTIVQERIVPREILNLTVVFDHDVIDGAPATRFTQRLVELIQCGYGLVEANE